MPRTRFRFGDDWRLKLLCALICCSSAMATARGDVSVEQIVSLAPMLKGDDAAIHRLYVRGTFGAADDPLYHFDLALEKPDHCSLVLRDGLDEIPILIAVDGKVMVYDAANSVIETFAGWGAFNCADDGNEFHMGFTLSWGLETPNAKATIFDIKSIVNRFTNDRKLKDMGQGVWQFTAVSQRGSLLTCLVAPDQKMPYRRVELRQANAPGPQVILEQIDLNYDRTKLALAPDLQELKSPVPIHEVKEPPSKELISRELTTTMASIAFRRAIYRPERRDGVSVKPQNFIDWVAARERDELAAKALKGLATREAGKDQEKRSGIDTQKP